MMELGDCMNDYEIAPIRGLKRFPNWQITFPYLKLALKYGLVGPWKGEFNRSVQFDAYSLCRGPSKGLPNGADLLITALMNSGVGLKHLKWMEAWLEDGTHLKRLKSLVEAVGQCSGLREMPQETIEALGDFVDTTIRDDSNKDGRGRKLLGGSRLFKWLSAWASQHVPMIDGELHHAFTRKPWRPTPKCHHSCTLLNDYKELLVLHFDQLDMLGKQLFRDLKGLLPEPIPPVRVLDSLIWFDWVAYKKPEFEGIWLRNKKKEKYDLAECGLKFVENRGVTPIISSG